MNNGVMNHGHVPNDYTVAYFSAFSRVDNHIVLYKAFISNNYRPKISSDNGTEADVTIFPDGDIANNIC